jgi:hypothetical protein
MRLGSTHGQAKTVISAKANAATTVVPGNLTTSPTIIPKMIHAANQQNATTGTRFIGNLAQFRWITLSLRVVFHRPPKFHLQRTDQFRLGLLKPRQPWRNHTASSPTTKALPVMKRAAPLIPPTES